MTLRKSRISRTARTPDTSSRRAAHARPVTSPPWPALRNRSEDSAAKLRGGHQTDVARLEAADGQADLIDTLRGVVPPVEGTIGIRVPYSLLRQRLHVLDDADSVLAAVNRLVPHADDNTLAAERSATPAADPRRTDQQPRSGHVRQLTGALKQYRGALLVASHDEAFLADLELDRGFDLTQGDNYRGWVLLWQTGSLLPSVTRDSCHRGIDRGREGVHPTPPW